jgi:hypothetical protein
VGFNSRDLDLGGITTAGTYEFRRIVTSGCTSAPSNVVTLNINLAIVAGAVTFTAGTGCGSFDPVASTSTAATGGTGAITYSWEYSTDAGTTWSPVTTTDPAVTAVVDAATINLGPISTPGVHRFRRVATAGFCTVPTAMAAAAITVLPVIATNTITAPATVNFCPTPTNPNPDAIVGSDPTGGTGAYTYQWQYQRTVGAPTVLVWTNVSATVPPSGNSSPTGRDFDLGTQTIPGTYLFRRLVTSGACANDPSNEVTLTITLPFTNNTLAAPATVDFCTSGDPAAIANSGVLSGGDGSYTYQWQVDTNNVDVWHDIPGETAQTYDPPLLSLVAGAQTVYRFRRLTSSQHCSDIATAPVTFTVRAPITENTISPSGPTQLCGAVNTGTINGSTPTGGTGVYNYQWQVSTDGVTFTNVGAVTATASLATQASPALPASGTISRWYRRLARSNATGVPCDFVPSDTVRFDWNPVVGTNTMTAVTQTLCTGTQPAVLNANTPTGGDGTYSFVWQVDTNNVNVWHAIPGSDVEDYQPPVLTHLSGVGGTTTIYRYRRLMTSGFCTTPSVSAVFATYTVQPDIFNNTAKPPSATVFCATGQPEAILGSVPVGGTPAAPTYQWIQRYNGGAWAAAPGTNNLQHCTPPFLSVSGLYEYARRVTSVGT